MNRTEIAEKFLFMEELFDRVAGRHTRMGLKMADLLQRVEALEETLRELAPQSPKKKPLDPHWDVT